VTVCYTACEAFIPANVTLVNTKRFSCIARNSRTVTWQFFSAT